MDIPGWLQSWKTWAGIGAGLALLGLGGRRVYRAYTVGNVQIDPTGLATGYGRTYRITADDRLWLMRALLGEVGESGWSSTATRLGGAAVLWALMEGYLLRGHRNYSTLASYARGYCQPINPRWAVAGADKCLEYPQSCTATQLARRARIAGWPLASVPSDLQQLVTSWSRGEVTNPVPGLTDWHASHWTGAVVEVAGNWFGAR